MHPVLKGIRLVGFDLDGTLVDSVPDLTVAVDTVLSECNLPPQGENRVRDWVGNGSLMLVERALTRALGKTPQASLLESSHARFLEEYGQSPTARTCLYAGVRETLDALRERGYELVVITNKPHALIEPILSNFALSDHFGLCLGGDSLPQKKPDPAPLLYAARHFEVSPEACLMVGDSRHDIEAGRRAGFRTLAVPYGYNHGEPVSDSGPDAMVESLRELI
ncbi:phosphoglycolate phosphatase [Litchfieldella xinjiangensis]|uniref:phosphoglycolate phosphatase n=1 Tax=Litchfieldella xinjiangensis TaxID=1166948 RepID=UPI0005BAF9DD|nr:phosphoglycolate phosphatase [Halomonas xinjiangensis]